MIQIEFDRGTLLISGLEDPELEKEIFSSQVLCSWDPRVEKFRVPAYQYYFLISTLHHSKIAYKDNAKNYEILDLSWDLECSPFFYQKEAIQAWKRNHKRGYVVLPTGTGKSLIGVLAIYQTNRSTLVVVPTLDLMSQWYDTLKSYFKNVEVGLIGGGYFEPAPLTVTTYDSAHRHLENLGNCFGLIIFDECHHLPGATYRLGAEFAIAPFRLGLSATPERVDGGHHDLDDLIGPCVYRKTIREMSGEYLAEYEVVRISARLSSEEWQQYRYNREIYLNFLRRHNLRLTGKNWQRFIYLSSLSTEGRKAFRAYLKQKEISQATFAKLDVLERLLKKHRKDRILIFTHDNATAYRISNRFLVPIITHQTKAKERRRYLVGFNQGTYSILVTSKVLNEGVNIPAANIGIVLSGSGSVREHVQRLGRILRKYGDKKALLYEIVAQDTTEEHLSKRRREHEAYKPL